MLRGCVFAARGLRWRAGPGWSLVLHNDLSYIDGALYYLHVVNERTLEGRDDLGGTIRSVKLFSRTRFASGSLHMTSTTVGDLRADEDVCATAVRAYWCAKTFQFLDGVWAAGKKAAV